MLNNRPLSYSETLIIGRDHELAIPPQDGLRRPILHMHDLEAVHELTGGFQTVILNIAGCTPDTILEYTPVEPGIDYYIASPTPEGAVQLQQV